MIRRLWLTLFGLCLAPSLGLAGDPLLFRYANAQNATDPRSVSMEFFKTELEKRSDGRIRVENYFGGILGTERTR